MSTFEEDVSVSTVRELLRSFNYYPQKHLSQNFLVNGQVVKQMVSALELNSTDRVVEIGAGLGSVSLAIAGQVAGLTAYEIDPVMFDILRQRVSKLEFNGRVSLLNEDFLVSGKVLPGQKVLSSLPYHVTSPIIHKLVNSFYQNWSIAVLMAQRDVFLKFIQAPPHAGYWYHYLSHFYQVEELMRVRPGSFWPQPRVESALFKLVRKEVFAPEPVRWSKFLHQIFQHPRKQLGSYFEREALVKAEIDMTRRAESLETNEIERIWNVYFA